MIEPGMPNIEEEEIAPPPPLAKVSLAQQMDTRMVGIEQELEFDRTAIQEAHITYLRRSVHIETSITVIMWSLVVLAVLLFALAVMVGVILGRLPL